MRFIDWQEFWWTNITGPRSMVEDVVDSLLDSKLVVLKVPSDLPWRSSMRSAIQMTFNEYSDSRDTVMTFIDAADATPDGTDIGRFLLHSYAPHEVEIGYRDKSRISIQEYILNHDVIKDRIIWVKGMDEKSFASWLRFCRGFLLGRAASSALFVLEVHGNVTDVEAKNIAYIDFDKCVSRFDVQQFNGLWLDNVRRDSDNLKQYMAAVTASVCGNDAEMSELLLRDVDFRNETVIDGLRRIDESGDYALRGASRAEGSDVHPLRLLRDGDDEALQRRVWAAQVRVLFPIIEIERQNLVSRYHGLISAALASADVKGYEGPIADPFDAELGHLVFMMGAGGGRALRIPSEKDRERIYFLHKCRNLLAHMSCCSPEQICGLLD